MTKEKTYTVWTYDVWGNTEDGFEVNDRSKETEDFKLPENATDRQIMQALKEHGLLKKTCQLRQLEIGGDDMSITVDESKSSYPLFGIELND